MSSLLLNAPYWLVALLAIIGVVLFFTGLRSEQSKLRHTAFALFAAAAVLLVLRLTVITDEKRIEKQTRALIEAISNNDWNAAAPYLQHARLYGWDGDALVARGKELAQRYGLSGVKINSIDLEPQPNVYVVKLSVTSYHKGTYIDSVPSTWSFEYQKRQQGWVLTHLEPRQIGIDDTIRAEEIIGGR